MPSQKGNTLKSRENDLDDVGGGLWIYPDKTTEGFCGDDGDGAVDGCTGDNIGVHGGVVSVWGDVGGVVVEMEVRWGFIGNEFRCCCVLVVEIGGNGIRCSREIDILCE